MSREIRCFEYVNHPYEAVRKALVGDAQTAFAGATSEATGRAEGVAAELRINVAVLQIGKDIVIDVGEPVEEPATDTTPAITTLPVTWKATGAPVLFPMMRADVSMYGITPTETQLDFRGEYDPPMWALGSMIDAVVGHRIAEATVHRFVRDVARYLRETLKESADS